MPRGPDDYAGYQRIASELVCALRGRRSQAAFSRQLGHASNIVHRWETRQSWPTAARFLAVCERVGIDLEQSYARMFQGNLAWLDGCAPASPEAIARLLRLLQGRVPMLELAARTGVNRFTISKWLRGAATPNLPRFLQLVDASSGRLLDLLSTLCDPEKLPSVAAAWRRLQLARRVAYDEPWSHAVLRALQLDAAPAKDQARWIARRLALDVSEVNRLLQVLRDAGQVKRTRGRWQALAVQRVDTGFEPARARELKSSWTRTAVTRLEDGAPGVYAYSLFEISADGLRRLRALHLEYFRAMQAVIAESSGTDRVGLFAAQLLDLAPPDDNALAADAG